MRRVLAVALFVLLVSAWPVIADHDTDNDGFTDEQEIMHGYDPLVPGAARLPKRIDVDLSEQTLRYFYGEFGQQGSFLISSGAPGYNTPKGTFIIRRKLPVANYSGFMHGRYYNYPGTKWNLEFAPKYFIHGAYWHNSFGTPRSKGCVNVAYKDMAALYEFADIGTVVTIHE
jgi:lipoprotein-anchoring transpeptidase ErfK/SrfK